MRCVALSAYVQGRRHIELRLTPPRAGRSSARAPQQRRVPDDGSEHSWAEKMAKKLINEEMLEFAKIRAAFGERFGDPFVPHSYKNEAGELVELQRSASAGPLAVSTNCRANTTPRPFCSACPPPLSPTSLSTASRTTS